MAIGTKPYNTFVAGLITEAGPLTFPENASFDELNCVLFRKGNRRRRLGVDYENSYTLSATTLNTATVRDQAIDTHVWDSVAGKGTRNFLIIQVDTTLHYYDLSNDPLSGGKKSFTTDLTSYTAAGQTDVGSEPVSITSGKGIMLVTSTKIEPFLVEYDPDGDLITETQINIEIRDFDGLDDGFEPNEEPSSTGSASAWATSTSYSVNDLVTQSSFTYICREAHTSGTFATDLTSGYWGNLTYHEYNLKNQGWNSPGEGVADPTSTYKTSKSKWPPNSKQWWVGKDSSDDFSATLLAKYDGGNTLAPRGHYLLNPFYKDRSDVSGVANIAVESETNRPEFIKFYAGRAWYFGIESSKINGHVFYSQVLTETNRAGRCYQEADPTTEELNELVDSDGGVIVIPEIGTIRGSLVIDRNLVLFASNGVWAITGASEDGFKATDFQVNRITSVGCNSSGSIVDVENQPYWWSDTGIYTLGQDQVSGRLTAQSMSQNTIESTYQDDIPSLSKTYTRAIYDPATKRVYWLYNTTAPSNDEYKWRYNAALIFDASIGAFYPWKISDLDLNSPYIVGGFNTQSVNSVSRTENVVDSSGNTVIDGSTNNVTVDVQTISGANSFLKYLCIKPDGAGNHNWTFALFNNGDFVDWETDDSVGKSYSSYLETGYETFGDLIKKKTTPMIYFFLGKTETGTSGGSLLSPSSCYFRTKWDWTNDGDTGKWSQRRQIYRLQRQFNSGIITDELPGETVIVTREKIQGRGRAVQYRFESEAGKDFNIHGWQAIVDQQDGI